MRLRDHEGTQTKRDAFSFDPRLLKEDDGYNVRDLSTPEARAKLAELKEQIRHAGVRTPLEVRMQGNEVLIVSGHRRHRAVMDLIEEGVEIKSVPVLQEPAGTSQEERTLNLALSNSGEPLTQMEIAHVVKRLCDFGWDHGKIAERMGWKSNNSVRQHLDLLELPAPIQAAVKRGHVSPTTARKCVAEVGAEKAAKIIADNEAQGKKTRPRDLPAKAKKIGKSDRLPVPLPKQAQERPTESEVRPPPAEVVPATKINGHPSLIEAAGNLINRADAVIITDAAGQRFRTVFADDFDALQCAFSTAGQV